MIRMETQPEAAVGRFLQVLGLKVQRPGWVLGGGDSQVETWRLRKRWQGEGAGQV